MFFPEAFIPLCLEDSDAKSEKGRTDAAVAGLEDRVQAASLENEGRVFRFSSTSVAWLLLLGLPRFWRSHLAIACPKPTPQT